MFLIEKKHPNTQMLADLECLWNHLLHTRNSLETARFCKTRILATTE